MVEGWEGIRESLSWVRKWYSSSSGDYSKLTANGGGPYGTDETISIDGATIVAAIRHERNTNVVVYTSIVDIFSNQLCLGVKNDGTVIVKISGANGANSLTGDQIPDGVPGVLSLRRKRR